MIPTVAAKLCRRFVLGPLALALLLIPYTEAQQAAASVQPVTTTAPGSATEATVQYRGGYAPDASGNLCARMAGLSRCRP